MEATKEAKIAIVNEALRKVANSIYQATVDSQVADKIEDKAMLANAANMLATFIKMKLAYEEALEAVVDEPETEVK